VPTGIDFIQDLAVVMLIAGAAGWLFQKAGLSVIVGYLVAGMMIGPFSPLQLVEQSQNIQILSQVGLIFLMFSIGLGLSLRRLRRLGGSVLAATVLASLLVFNGWRLLGLALGWTEAESLFLAGMFTVSSSAIIGKTLQELGITHQKSGQLALGVTVLEDMVAIVVLTVLISYAGMGGVEEAPVLRTLGLFGAFVIFLGVTGLLLVPRFLRLVDRSATAESQTLLVAAMLFLVALLAYQAGYSLALGAFLLGAIVAETPQKGQVERTFEGLRHLFATVFFVSIGMLIDFQMLFDQWVVILFISLVAILGRAVACGIALLLIGNSTGDSVRAGVALTPVGEFSFIIAQAGIGALVLGPEFYPLAVGVSLLTTLACPILIRYSDRIAEAVESREPESVRAAFAFYRKWLARLNSAGQQSLFWRLSRKRLIQIGVGVFFITGLLILAGPVYTVLVRWVGENMLFPHGTGVLFWAVLGLVVLVPLVAVWRNISALAMIYAEMTTRGRERGSAVQVFVENGLKAGGGLALFLWSWSFLPLGAAAPVILGAVLILVLIMLLFFRRKLVLIHSRFEVEIEEVLAASARAGTKPVPTWLSRHRGWDLDVKEFELPASAACSGRRVDELELRNKTGCSIVAIDRQGHFIGNPGPQTRLFPRDRLLLLGNMEEIAAARRLLGEVSEPGQEGLEDVRLERVVVPVGSPRLDRTLAELNISGDTGVQVAGIRRNGNGGPQMNPGGGEILFPEDELLVLGTAEQVRRFTRWLGPED